MEKMDVLECIINTFDNGNKALFARRIGITPQNLNGWLNRGRIEYDTIYRTCPDINPVWLLTNGEEGEIIDNESTEAKQRRHEEENVELIELRAENKLLRELAGLKEKKHIA